MGDILKIITTIFISLLAVFGPGTTVASVTDGDTLKLSTGETVRLSGIDAPELKQCYSTESAKLVSELVLGKKVTVNKASPDKDWYGRTLAYLFVDGSDLVTGFRIRSGMTGGKAGMTVNEELVQAGAARYYYFPGADAAYQSQIIAAENEARLSKKGLWGQCFDPALGSCAVKANLDKNDVRRYLLPSDRHYAVTVVNPTRGDLWLCSEAEAAARGFGHGDQY